MAVNFTQEVNYSHNEIEEICDLSAHHSLTRLTLDRILDTLNTETRKCMINVNLVVTSYNSCYPEVISGFNPRGAQGDICPPRIPVAPQAYDTITSLSCLCQTCPPQVSTIINFSPSMTYVSIKPRTYVVSRTLSLTLHVCTYS